jgi:hypothetical protein
MNKTLAACTAALLALGGALVPAMSASAHVNAVTLDCNKAFVSLTSYEATAVATVVLDGTPLQTGTFGGGYTLDQALDPLVNHTLTVVADSADGVGGTEYDVDVSLVKDTCAPVIPPAEHWEVGLYLYKKLVTGDPAGWTNSGPQTFCESKTGTDWFTTVTCALPPTVCGPGWAFQQDKVHWTEPATFTWPASILYDPTAPNDGDIIGWPPIYDAMHGELSALGVVVPPCDVEVPSVDPPWFEDECGPADEAGYSLYVPTDTASIHYEKTLDTAANWVKIVAQPKPGFFIKDGVVKEWTYNYTDDACPPTLDATASATTTPPSCTAAGTVTFAIENADWENTTDLTDGSRLAIAKAGHAFPGGLTQLPVTYVLQPKFNAAVCTDLPTLSLPVTGSSPSPSLGIGGLALLMLGLTASITATTYRRRVS